MAAASKALRLRKNTSVSVAASSESECTEFAAPSKKLSGQVKSDDAAATVPMGPTTSNHAADDHVHVIGRVALAGNHRVVSVTDRASTKRENAVLYSSLIAIMQKCF